MRVLPTGEEGRKSVVFHQHDRSILALLCANVRLPISKIAKLLKLSRQSVEYRIKVMEDKHLIAGSRTVVNVKKLGYFSYHFFLNIPNAKAEEQLIKAAIANDDVNALIRFSGKWNFELAIMARTPEEAQRVFLKLTQGIDVIGHFIVVLIRVIKSSILPSIVSNKKTDLRNIRNDPSFSRQFTLSEESYEPDKKDKKLLYLLSQNAQMSLTELGKKINLSGDAAGYRVKKLIRSKYIINFRPVIDYSILNLSIQAVVIRVHKRTSKEDSRFGEYLRSQKAVLWATEAMGIWDYLIYIINDNQEEIHDFITGMKREFEEYIHSYEMMFAYHEYKYGFMTKSMGRAI